MEGRSLGSIHARDFTFRTISLKSCITAGDTMTLQEWTDKFQTFTANHPSGAVGVPFGLLETPAYREIFHLNDFVISSITAGTIWLVPRAIKRE